MLDRFWMDFACTFGPTWGHLGRQVGAMLKPKTDFYGCRKASKNEHEVESFSGPILNRFWSDFQCQNRIKIVPKSISRAIKIQSCASSISPIFTNENEDAASGKSIKHQSKIVLKNDLI